MSKNALRRVGMCLTLAFLFVVGQMGWALLEGLVWPEASGDLVDSSDKLTIDYSHADEGYVMAHGPSTNQQLKLRVQKDGGMLDYDLNGNEEWEIIPLQLGDGTYTFMLYVNAGGNKYAPGGKMTVSTALADPYEVFLIPSQYVYYEADTPAVAKSEEICAGLETDQQKYEAVREYIKANYEYDYDKAASRLPAGTLPSVDYIWDTGKGICQDLAALAACMLRVQGVPTQLVIGYVGGSYYHAWNNVIIDGEYIQYDPTADVSNIPLDMGYQMERFY